MDLTELLMRNLFQIGTLLGTLIVVIVSSRFSHKRTTEVLGDLKTKTDTNAKEGRALERDVQELKTRLSVLEVEHAGMHKYLDDKFHGLQGQLSEIFRRLDRTK